MLDAIASLPTAGFIPKVICVYRRITVVMDFKDFEMTSRLPSGLFSVHLDGNCDLLITIEMNAE